MKIIYFFILNIYIFNKSKYKNNFLENINKLNIKDLEILINNFKNNLSQEEIQFSKKIINEKKYELDKIINLLSNMTKKINVFPVIKWGQSRFKIFLYIKLAHRLDSPGCLDILKENISIKNNSVFNLDIECIQGHQPIKFTLEIPLRNPVKNEIKIKKGSVGVLEITIDKEDAIIWPILPINELYRKKYPMKIWQEIESIDKRAMDEFYDIYEEYENKKNDL